ncbi:Putative teichuronic acid biosynthesis glycosyltransferase TuaH [Koleobacter methoxysyntrophicus]|uniref:Teichuronic acid biosynthesis glycosyltransferase TuaH n=1 Tax=Koleobacter methoxysyntrophicus TaxID=2751313 RepID=A0A8A0RJ90_9FIRM|nr:glycosyltransferase family 4 protein [Koleobacter methoxysyntrophicus]QSQ07962.1 Putative teichuronic acid biosynthesis glycosyltransferase TuaH [Koleobacter methoxysyntrophicus]
MVDNKKSKTIWVFHHYATPPTMNGFTRPYNFAINMKDENYKTIIFAASYLHFSDVNLIRNKTPYIVQEHSNIPFVFINTPSSAKNTLARVKNMWAYYMNLFSVTKTYSKKEGKPDLIYASSPHPLALIAGIKIAKKYNVPCVCEVRDLWPEAIFAFGKTKESSVLGKLLIAGEHWIYKKADALIFLKEGDTDYLKERKWTLEQGGDIDLKKCYYINNGVDINAFNKQIKNEILEDEDLLADKFNVVYTGAIRPINNVGNILDAAKLLKDHTDIQFLIYGDGNQLESLRQRVIDEGLNNVKMKGYVEKKYIPYVLSKSSVNILNYSQTKYNWSRGNSSNKLFEYMASGKPIISTVKMGYCLLEKYKCGISLEKDTPHDLAKAIIQIYELPRDKYNEMGENAKNGAKDFDYKVLTKKMLDVIGSLIS